MSPKPKTANPFYLSAGWAKARFRALHRDGYKCMVCGKCLRAKGVGTVHHIQELRERPDLALEQSNLMSVCHPCHNSIHAGRGQPAKAAVGDDGLPPGWG
jgi:5-methylcytosine-specific restriction endonuclease McrA